MKQDEIHHELRHAVSDLALSKRRIEQATHRIDQVTGHLPDCSSSIRVKSAVVMQELIVVPWHPMLKEVVFWGIERWPGRVLFTSGFREGDKGVHGVDPLRGTDLRSTEFSNPRIVEHEINQEWDYGKINPRTGESYQVCMYHQTVRCKKCGHKFEVDSDIGVLSSTVCPECHAGRESLKDFGPHFHIQSRNETKRRR